jgi:hypothetical protein
MIKPRSHEVGIWKENVMIKPRSHEVGIWKENVLWRSSPKKAPSSNMLVEKYIKEQLAGHKRQRSPGHQPRRGGQSSYFTKREIDRSQSTFRPVTN